MDNTSISVSDENTSTPSQLEQVIVDSKNLGTALAINYVYNYLYLFLRKKHTVKDHLDHSTPKSEVQNDNEECHCGCVLNGCIDVFLKELDASTPNKSGKSWQERIPPGSSKRKFVLLCDPAASRERDMQVYDSHKSSWFRLSTMQTVNKVKFRAFDRDYLIPVHVVAEEQSLLFSGLASVDSILYDLFDALSSISNLTQDYLRQVQISQLRTDFYSQFIATVKQFVAYDDQLNESFLQLVDLPYSPEFKDVQNILINIVTKHISSQIPITYNQTETKLDESSILHAQVISLFYGFLSLITWEPEFSTHVKKYYLIFPRSGKVNAVESLSYLKRDRANDVVVQIARCGDNTRPYFIHAWKYNYRTTERQIYLETPSALAMFEHMQDVVADKPNARIQSPECCSVIKEALSGLEPGESLSWKLADALQNFMNMVPGFNYQDFPVIKWDDVNGDELILPQ